MLTPRRRMTTTLSWAISTQAPSSSMYCADVRNVAVPGCSTPKPIVRRSLRGAGVPWMAKYSCGTMTVTTESRSRGFDVLDAAHMGLRRAARASHRFGHGLEQFVHERAAARRGDEDEQRRVGVVGRGTARTRDWAGRRAGSPLGPVLEGSRRHGLHVC